MTRVTIVTTCFNSAATIRDTIESIRSNIGTFEIEHIITDAGSSDGTLDIIRSYGDAVTLYETPGLNQSAGINFGFRKASGSIVAFLNADDLYYPSTVQTVVDAFDAHPEKRWLIGYCPIIDEKGQEQTSWITTYKNFFIRHYSYFWLLVENFIPQPAVFLRRDVVEEFGELSESENLCMDYEYWLRIGRTLSPIIIQRNLAQFRRMTTTKSNYAFEKQFADDARLGTQYAKTHGLPVAAFLKRLTYWRTILVYKRLYRVSPPA